MRSVRYFRPNSVAWWSGVGLVVLGVAALAMPASYTVTELGRAVALWVGGSDSSPGTMIAVGVGIIGLRDKLERPT